jgi:hypothetical protein
MSNRAKRTPEQYEAAQKSGEVQRHRKKRDLVKNETFVVGIKYYPAAKRCPKCGTMNHKRTEEGICQSCIMRKAK